MHEPSGHWGNQLLDGMPQSVTRMLSQSVLPRMLPQGFICFEAGNPIQEVYFPTSGLISLVLTMEGGELIEPGIIGREGAAGLQCAIGHRISFARGIVQIAGAFYPVESEFLRRAIASSEQAKALVNQYTDLLLDEAHQLTACNALHQGEARLARWLLQSADRTGTEQLLLTQEFLGEMLGMRRTTVTWSAGFDRIAGAVTANLELALTLQKIRARALASSSAVTPFHCRVGSLRSRYREPTSLSVSAKKKPMHGEWA
jgi:CRP-like cAMP-binding protein